MMKEDFATFERRALAAGFDEALERQWAPDTAVPTHSHDFDADAVVTQGEMWLCVNGEVQHLRAGSTFTLPRGMPHEERYGPEGATYWVARRGV